MNEIRERVAPAYSDGGLASLRHLADHHAEIGYRSLDGLLQLLQVAARVLDSWKKKILSTTLPEMVFENLIEFLTGESDEQPEDVIRALENPEYPQIPHDLLESGLPHVPHAAHDLDALVHHEPGRL